MLSSKVLSLSTFAYMAISTLAAPNLLPRTAAQYGDGPRDDYHCDGVAQQKKNLYAQQGTTLGNTHMKCTLMRSRPLLIPEISHRLRHCHLGKVLLLSISVSQSFYLTRHSFGGNCGSPNVLSNYPHGDNKDGPAMNCSPFKNNCKNSEKLT